MFCQRCGNLEEASSIFCRHCGAKIIKKNVTAFEYINPMKQILINLAFLPLSLGIVAGGLCFLNYGPIKISERKLDDIVTQVYIMAIVLAAVFLMSVPPYVVYLFRRKKLLALLTVEEAKPTREKMGRFALDLIVIFALLIVLVVIDRVFSPHSVFPTKWWITLFSVGFAGALIDSFLIQRKNKFILCQEGIVIGRLFHRWELFHSFIADRRKKQFILRAKALKRQPKLSTRKNFAQVEQIMSQHIKIKRDLA